MNATRGKAPVAAAAATEDGQPLTLVLLPREMDTRRLRCLVVGSGDLVTTQVNGRDATVGALLVKLCEQHDELDERIRSGCAQLFRARQGNHNNNSGEWLTSDSHDAQRLAGGTLRGGPRVRFITVANAMGLTERLHDFFPSQPPMYHGVCAVIHVVVCVPSGQQSVVDPLTLRADGPMAELLASVKSAKATVVTAKLQRFLGVEPRHKQPETALLVRGETPQNKLWLSRDKAALSTMYVPATWRLLGGEVFRWIMVDTPSTQKGRCAILTGAAERVGKSAFFGYLLFQIMRLDRSPLCVVDVPGVTFALVDPGSGTAIEGNRGVDFEDALMERGTIYLYDATSHHSKPFQRSDIHARMILMVPQCARGRQNKRTKTFVLPLWNLEDIRMCTRLCYANNFTVAHTIALFHKWGGVPGCIFVEDAAASGAELERALRLLSSPKVMKALTSVKRTGAWEASASDTAWTQLIALTTDDTFAHDGQVAFCSQFVCDRAMELVTKRTEVILSREALHMPMLWAQIRNSITYLQQEEEEKQQDHEEEEAEYEDDDSPPPTREDWCMEPRRSDFVL